MLRDEDFDSVASRKSSWTNVDGDGPDVRVDGGAQVGTTPGSINIVKDNCPAGTPVTISSPFSTRRDSDAGSPSQLARQCSLKRTGSNIASLRAAFEHADVATSPSRHFEKSPSRSFSGRSENVSSRNREKDAEIARLERQLADEIETRQSCQSQLKISRERCEQLEREIRTGPPRGSQNGTLGGPAAEGETMSIQRQLYELKRSISTATRIENQVSDSTFAQELANLHHELQNFIVNTFRRVKLAKAPQELCEVLEGIVAPQQQVYLHPIFSAFEPSMKLAAMQATVVSYMMEVFNEPLLFGLPNQQEWRENLRETMKTLPTILTPSTFNKWRYLTLDAIRQSVGIEESVHLAAGGLTRKICTTLSALTGVETLGTRASSLESIVMRAVQLSHLFRVQRAQYEFVLPTHGEPFKPDTMEDHAVDCETLDPRNIVCATFPSIIKHGDESGDDMLLSNVVMKAKVLCES